MRKVVICDFDGTLIQGNLENTFVSYLLKETKYGWRILLVSLFTLPINLLLNRFYWPSIFKSWTFVLKREKQEVIKAFLISDYFKRSTDMRLREDIISKLSSFDSDLIVILTGSDEDLVEAFIHSTNRIKFDKIIGSQVESGFFRVKRHPFGKGKTKYVKSKYYNIGIANDFSDHFYMDMCNEKYYV